MFKKNQIKRIGAAALAAFMTITILTACGSTTNAGIKPDMETVSEGTAERPEPEKGFPFGESPSDNETPPGDMPRGKKPDGNPPSGGGKGGPGAAPEGNLQTQ